jgi:hypothetical protein
LVAKHTNSITFRLFNQVKFVGAQAALEQPAINLGFGTGITVPLVARCLRGWLVYGT